jgi:hypothetical protein
MTAPELTRAGQGRPAIGRSPRRQALRAAAMLAVPTIAYFAARPWASSDAVALAIGGAVPLGYQVAVRRRVDAWALASGIGFALACLVSLLAGGSSLPLTPHEAAVTFLVGLGPLAAVLVRRPIPLGRWLKVPAADRRLDATLSTLVGGFLVLHASMHLALAMMLSTSTYLIAGRLINWATVAVAAVAMYGYLRRVRRLQRQTGSATVGGDA